MNLMKFLSDSNAPKDSSSTGQRNGLKSRLSHYKLVTRKFPCFDEDSGKLFSQRIRFLGQVIHSGKPKSKPRFRVFMESESDDLPEPWCDWIDFDREDDAIDFMVTEHAHKNLLADENMLHDGRYFWSIKEGQPYKRYFGYFDGRWI